MSKKTIPGINIQYPISRLIFDGKKQIETRTYPIPKHYIGNEIALIETPGRSGNFKARIIGIIIFGPSFKYKSKSAFYKDSSKHFVTADSEWAWADKEKWGWPVRVKTKFDSPIPLKVRTGIRFTKKVPVNY